MRGKSSFVRAMGAIVVIASAWSCKGDPSDMGPPAGTVPFVDATADVGLDFVHFNGASGELYFVEVFGAGAAFLDYDRDGDLDLYLVQGRMLGAGKTLDDAILDPPTGDLVDRLYRNDLVESGTLRFVDVTERSEIVGDAYGMGVATGDYDNDGFTDLYVTAYGENRLWRNQGDGSFVDATEASGTGEGRWSTSAAFLDFDADGWLDLYVGNYVGFRPDVHRPCVSSTGGAEYCGPLSYDPFPDRLFRNTGGGRFEDVSATSGISEAFGGALGVVADDFDGDGRIDLYVANDGMPNRLWINRGDGGFDERALLAGCAFNADGRAEASMGVDAVDFDDDGDVDLFMTHLNDETNTLYLNDGSGWFEDRTVDMGLAAESRPFTGFGTAWIDYDRDRHLDLFVVNGAVKQLEERMREGDPFPLDQHNQLFRNRGDGTFEEVTGRSGAVFAEEEVSRGAAFGDVDNDGDVDIVVTNNGGRARLLLNQAGSIHHWVGLRVIDEHGRDASGARVEIVDSEGRTVRRTVRTAASYLSAHDPRLLIGLGKDEAVGEVRVRWADGHLERWGGVPIDRYTTLRRGEGLEQ